MAEYFILFLNVSTLNEKQAFLSSLIDLILSSVDVEGSGGTFPQTVTFRNLNSVTKLSSTSVSLSCHLVLFFYKLCI